MDRQSQEHHRCSRCQSNSKQFNVTTAKFVCVYQSAVAEGSQISQQAFTHPASRLSRGASDLPVEDSAGGLCQPASDDDSAASEPLPSERCPLAFGIGGLDPRRREKPAMQSTTSEQGWPWSPQHRRCGSASEKNVEGCWAWHTPAAAATPCQDGREARGCNLQGSLSAF